MNESDIRRRVVKALGETSYPPGLTSHIEAGLTLPRIERRPDPPRVLALVAALLAVATVATFVFIARSQRSSPTAPTPPIPANSGGTASSSRTAPYPNGILCHLPMDKGRGAFLDVPANWHPDATPIIDTVTDDPTSDVNLPDGEPRIALSYDWPLQRWLPVPYSWVSPDGTRYVYTDSQGRIHLVGISNGSDQVIATGASWGIYSFRADGIYVGRRDPTRQPALTGLWRIPPIGGAPQQLTTQETWLGIGADAAWSMVQDGTPPSDSPPIPEGSLGTVLQRLDLKTGAIKTWYTTTDGRYRIGTVDLAGRPVLIQVAINHQQLFIVTAPGAAQRVDAYYAYDVMADAHGVWFEDTRAISVYLVEGSAGRRMGQYDTYGAFKFAGPCK